MCVRTVLQIMGSDLMTLIVLFLFRIVMSQILKFKQCPENATRDRTNSWHDRKPPTEWWITPIQMFSKNAKNEMLDKIMKILSQTLETLVNDGDTVNCVLWNHLFVLIYDF